MSYALETKKRKFDRILESLTEGSSQSRVTPESRLVSTSNNNGSLSSRTGSLDSSKRRRVSPTFNRASSHSSLLNHYLPSSRDAFLERLETYRHVTKWHIPSTSLANAAEWAKRGWICVGTDTVSCGACSERVTVDLNTDKASDREKDAGDTADQDTTGLEQDEEERDNLAIQFQEALVKRYQQMMTSAHSAACSWRKRGCDVSIQRIEGLLTTSTAMSSLRLRYISMIDKGDSCPAVSDLPAYDVLPAPSMKDFAGLDLTDLQIDALKLAICGWQYKEEDVVECRHCFRSLGLWLYRGEHPTVENLDAIESHLEYCPWRSPGAQDTELMIHPESGSNAGKKLRLPGWALVYHSVKKQTIKKQGRHDSNLIRTSQDAGDGTFREELSPEQREKRMSDLMRRIKEIKKPFNVKSLLRKKDKPVR